MTERQQPVYERFGVRMKKDLIDQIQIAAATRKARGTDPQTQAEIAIVAMKEWLQRNGH